jgi:hypothetical protein
MVEGGEKTFSSDDDIIDFLPEMKVLYIFKVLSTSMDNYTYSYSTTTVPLSIIHTFVLRRLQQLKLRQSRYRVPNEYVLPVIFSLPYRQFQV